MQAYLLSFSCCSSAPQSTLLRPSDVWVTPRPVGSLTNATPAKVAPGGMLLSSLSSCCRASTAAGSASGPGWAALATAKAWPWVLLMCCCCLLTPLPKPLPGISWRQEGMQLAGHLLQVAPRAEEPAWYPARAWLAGHLLSHLSQRMLAMLPLGCMCCCLAPLGLLACRIAHAAADRCVGGCRCWRRPPDADCASWRIDR
jgi:hypothetical protein